MAGGTTDEIPTRKNAPRLWMKSRPSTLMSLLIVLLVIIVIFVGLDSYLLFHVYRSKTLSPRAPVYGTIFGALGAFVAAGIAVVAVFRAEQQADRKEHNDVRPAIDVRALWTMQQLLFEISNEGEHPAMDFLVVLERLHSEQIVKLFEWDDPQTTVLRPYSLDQRRQHYKSAGYEKFVMDRRIIYPEGATVNMTPMTPVIGANMGVVQAGEPLRLTIVYRDVLDAWWQLRALVHLGIPPYVPGLAEGTLTALDMGGRDLMLIHIRTIVGYPDRGHYLSNRVHFTRLLSLTFDGK